MTAPCREEFQATPYLMPKNYYVFYNRNLMFYLKLGMWLSNVHRVSGFALNRRMEPYFSMITRLRAAAEKRHGELFSQVNDKRREWKNL